MPAALEPGPKGCTGSKEEEVNIFANEGVKNVEVKRYPFPRGTSGNRLGKGTNMGKGEHVGVASLAVASEWQSQETQ